jgi:hypothetical protein
VKRARGMSTAKRSCMRQRALLLAALLALPLALPSTSRAAESTEPATEVSSAPAAEAPQRWYGWQPLMVDVGSIATMVGGGFVRGAGTGPIEILGGAGCLLGAPLIHLGHEHPGKAGTSLALRTLVPAAGALLGVLIAWAAFPNGTETGSGDSVGIVDKSVYQAAGGFLGFGAGAIVGMVVDDVVVAREKAPPPVHPDSHPTIEPRVAGVRGGATFGIGGTF